jgi:hypothetical protein
MQPEATPTPAGTATPDSHLAPTPTIDPALLQPRPGEQRTQPGGNQNTGIILSVGLASLLVAVGFGVVVVRRRGAIDESTFEFIQNTSNRRRMETLIR